MTSSSSAPKLPMWVFIATDVVLMAVAILIWKNSSQPFSPTETMAIAVSVLTGALILVVPLILRYERVKNETLDERQRALESLSRTVTSSAEQISIATNGLHEIAELAQKNLRHAEQLPHKLQEKIAEFQAQLANASDSEKEELEKELAELRASETERLEAISDKIAKTAAELAKLEAATHQHLTAANEAVAKLSSGTASAIGKAQAAAEQALAQARQEAARSIGETTGNAVKSIEVAKAAALADFAAQVNEGVAQLRRITDELRITIATLRETGKTATGSTESKAETDGRPETAPAAPVTNTTPAETPVAPAEPAVEPKRLRKSRREEPVTAEPTVDVGAAGVADVDGATPDAPAETPVVPAPAPIPIESITDAAPVAPNTTEPTATPGPAEPSATAEPPKPARKRAVKKTDDDQPALVFAADENGEADAAPSGVVERVLTSDGATRLVVTAYIGIGNRLFIRGNGPGLSWEKGVPLQFVSIGKWRWETNEAGGPVQFKLLKNDEQECTGLGTLTIEPGHQHEVTAAFN